MFVQTISGTVTDPEGFQRQADRWETDLRPGAAGYLVAIAATAVVASLRFVLNPWIGDAAAYLSGSSSTNAFMTQDSRNIS